MSHWLLNMLHMTFKDRWDLDSEWLMVLYHHFCIRQLLLFIEGFYNLLRVNREMKAQLEM